MVLPAKKQTRKGKNPMSETSKIIEIEILRYLPESDEAPHSEVYKVPFTDDMSVLQGAQYIKDNFDGSLTCRCSCDITLKDISTCRNRPENLVEWERTVMEMVLNY